MDVKTLSATDAAYIAGLIDGEGTITLIRKHRNENRQLSVSIASSERGILDYVLLVTGAGKITRKRTSQAHHAPQFAYAIYNRQALALLQQVASFLRSYKAQRAQLILQHYLSVTPRNGKYSDAQRLARAAFEQQVLATKPHQEESAEDHV
ncbi:LAGLIDADG family homing endonuclease [Permianibacter aggregans]|uniref:LAGLIDADG DNA endonuclease family protein n=1 Tax=Permianibacter aggregans TaxID=1510150 RepID=A0A4R6UKX1_9GAMM|nr:LAGLIDADG family homing endonuclease [Permianibacter aggregans]QGX39147.1 hypothetical protein E2H98_05505 [Permianibacter aggregans]TDQ47640.1 LAGLIDADG DNA endonuclease family protein [Permianibacter aggregans]